MIVNYLLYIVSLSNFISIAATQITFGILIIFLLKNYPDIRKYPHIKFFILLFLWIEISFIFNHTEVKHFYKKLFHWWLYFPFFISYFLIKSDSIAKNILKFTFIGASFSSLYGIYQLAIEGERGAGFYSHALTSGNNWALSLILCYGIILAKLWDNRKEAYFYIAMFILIFLGLLSSQAKGPLLYFLFTSFFLNYIFLKKKGIVISISTIFLLVLIIFITPSLKERFSDLYYGINNPYTSTGNRIILWKHSLKIIKEKPLLGIGGGFKKYIDKKTKIKLKWRSHPHNAFLTIAVNHGIPALIFLLIIFYNLFKSFLKKLDNKYSYIAISFLFLYLLEGLTENNFGDSEVKMFFWFIMGLFYAVLFKQKKFF